MSTRLVLLLLCAVSLLAAAPAQNQERGSPGAGRETTGSPAPSGSAPRMGPEPAAGVPSRRPPRTPTPDRPKSEENSPPESALPVQPTRPIGPQGGWLRSGNDDGSVQPFPDPADSSAEPEVLLVLHDGMVSARAFANRDLPPGFAVLRRQTLAALGLVMTALRVPGDRTAEAGLAEIRARAPLLLVDVDSEYALLGAEGARHYAAGVIGWGATSETCGRGQTLGMIDTGVDRTHPALRDQAIEVRSFVTRGREPGSEKHGTAVAGLLVGHSATGEFVGLLPGATLRVAGVFERRSDGKEITRAEWIVLAVDWLVETRTPVVNLSFGGSSNRVLGRALERALARDTVLVAAAGNGGPAAEPVHPAAQPGVIAVAAVDAKLQAWKGGNRGTYLDLAAPGVDLWVPRPGSGGAFVSGTSYAAPFVAAATALLRPPGRTHRAGVDALIATSVDLGAPGRDPVFGAGLLRAQSTCGRS